MPVKRDGKKILVCRKCGYEEESNIDMKLKENIKNKNEDKIRVVEKNKSTLPVTEIRCEKCGNNEAEWWTRQTRSTDEPETRFYRCTKCGHTWREYS